jgi:hypothetical protein
MREILPKLNKPEFYSVFYQESATYNFLYGNKDTGYFYMDKFLGLKDSLTSSENAQITNELQTKYETEKKDLELKQTNRELNFQEEKNKQKTTRNYLEYKLCATHTKRCFNRPRGVE